MALLVKPEPNKVIAARKILVPKTFPMQVNVGDEVSLCFITHKPVAPGKRETIVTEIENLIGVVMRVDRREFQDDGEHLDQCIVEFWSQDVESANKVLANSGIQIKTTEAENVYGYANLHGNNKGLWIATIRNRDR
jgi:hypothetical protein